MSSPEALSHIAHNALELVEKGMLLGLGTGRAAEAFIRALAGRIDQGLLAGVRGIPTSVRSQQLAESLGVELGTLDEIAKLDIAFDGADEVSPGLDLTKGLGGALLRERVVAHAADRFVVLITPEKQVAKLGTQAPIPIEVVPFAREPVRRELEPLGRPRLRSDDSGKPISTDNGNLLIDLGVDPLADPQALDAAIRRIPGVVDNGMFLQMAHLVIVGAGSDVQRLERKG